MTKSFSMNNIRTFTGVTFSITCRDIGSISALYSMILLSGERFRAIVLSRVTSNVSVKESIFYHFILFVVVALCISTHFVLPRINCNALHSSLILRIRESLSSRIKISAYNVYCIITLYYYNVSLLLVNL